MRELSPTTAFIILTCRESAQSMRLALRVGASNYLLIPYKVEEIRSAFALAIRDAATNALPRPTPIRLPESE
jgi:DNA-binding NarL/FixJ family response regulator